MQNQKDKIQSMELLRTFDSGYDWQQQQKVYEQSFNEFFSLFVFEKHDELDKTFTERIDQVVTQKIKGLKIVNLLVLGRKVEQQEIFFGNINEMMADQIAIELMGLFSTILELKNFQGKDFILLDLFQLKSILKTLPIYYSDFILREHKFISEVFGKEVLDELLERLFAEISPENSLSDLYDSDMAGQRHRILAHYYRLKGNQDKAEEEIVAYREAFGLGSKKDPKITPRMNQEAFPKDKVLENLDQIYAEGDMLQKDVALNMGLNENTCFYYGCGDCCFKDFPECTLTEFLHIKNWLEEQGMDIEEFVQKAEQIQVMHEENHGSRLPIVEYTKDAKKEINPHDFLFPCPFLDKEQKCSVHPVRPIVCRAFGSSTVDRKKVLACSYYFNQFRYNSTHMNEREAYDPTPAIALLRYSDEYLSKKEGYKIERPVATLVAWLTELDKLK